MCISLCIYAYMHRYHPILCVYLYVYIHTCIDVTTFSVYISMRIYILCVYLCVYKYMHRCHPICSSELYHQHGSSHANHLPLQPQCPTNTIILLWCKCLRLTFYIQWNANAIDTFCLHVLMHLNYWTVSTGNLNNVSKAPQYIQLNK